MHLSLSCGFRAGYGVVDSGSAVTGGCPASDAVLVRAAFPHRGAALSGAVAGSSAVVSVPAWLPSEICSET